MATSKPNRFIITITIKGQSEYRMPLWPMLAMTTAVLVVVNRIDLLVWLVR